MRRLTVGTLVGDGAETILGAADPGVQDFMTLLESACLNVSAEL